MSPTAMPARRLAPAWISVCPMVNEVVGNGGHGAGHVGLVLLGIGEDLDLLRQHAAVGLQGALDAQLVALRQRRGGDALVVLVDAGWTRR
jgi:hypothetical protein